PVPPPQFGFFVLSSSHSPPSFLLRPRGARSHVSRKALRERKPTRLLQSSASILPLPPREQSGKSLSR
ncbi:hypothetical protein BaRGS_00004832, partial [Batillaria attramentaria]